MSLFTSWFDLIARIGTHLGNDERDVDLPPDPLASEPRIRSMRGQGPNGHLLPTT
jgi:hypothetical protein